MLLRPILLVAAACYRVAYKLHHCLCLRPGKPLAHAKLIVVGSFMAGGAGKTPFTAWLAQFILENARIAILCHSKAQDEAEMLRQQFAGLPQVRIIATSNRYTTAHEIDRDYDYIICDDGFEDTRLVNAFTIRLDWDEPPAHIADLLPAGKNRSLLQDHDEPAIVLRCIQTSEPADAGQNFAAVKKCDAAKKCAPADITFSIACIKNAAGIAFDPQLHPDAVAACGIGNPERFREDLAACGISPAEFVARRDHDSRFEQTINILISRKKSVIITAKDTARLPRDLRAHPDIYTAYQQVSISGEVTDRLREALTQGMGYK